MEEEKEEEEWSNTGLARIIHTQSDDPDRARTIRTTTRTIRLTCPKTPEAARRSRIIRTVTRIIRTPDTRIIRATIRIIRTPPACVTWAEARVSPSPLTYPFVA